jgi:CRISPR-associated protein Cmr5
MSSQIKELERERARFAYEKVKETINEIDNSFEDKDKKERNKKDYRSYLKKIPTYIQTNGLAATCAFIFSKKEKSVIYGKIYNQIDRWLKDLEMKDETELIEWVVELDSPTYRRATKEIIALLMWMGRFAEGMVEK